MTEATPSADYSLRILWTAARWIEDVKGRDALEAVAKEIGITADDFDARTGWLSHEQMETFLLRARELAGSDEALEGVFGHRLKESYGAFVYMIWALSPQMMMEGAAKMTNPTLTKVGHFEVLESSKSHFRLRYRTTRPESRLMCASRRIAWALGPSVWGLPPAELKEHACTAKGDDFCEYELRWFQPWSKLPMALGLLLGLLLAVPLGMLGHWGLAVSLPLLMAGAGYVLDLRRTSQANLEYANELKDVMAAVGATESEARAEIYALHQRQREWIRVMEQQVADRTSALEKVVDGIAALQKTRVSTIRGFSHDLRNPLFVVRGNAQFLLERVRDGEEGDAIRDMDKAAAQIETMLTGLMDLATKDTGTKLQPKPLPVPPLADTLRRRLRALVHGRDIKVTVFCTREAPEKVVVDQLVFDRIVDNLLTNAAKYTQRGSIVLEIDGTPATGSQPEFLTLKLSDTGQGIPAHEVERIFRPRSSDEPSGPQSYGVGLSSVVRLMAQFGGRLDVMSKEGVGTTFWAHVPVEAREERSIPGEDNFESMIMRVVRIRRAEGT